MASCETPESPADQGEEKQPLTAAEPLPGAAYRPEDGDGFSDISDSELVAVQDETLNDSRASACFIETVEPVEVTDLQVWLYKLLFDSMVSGNLQPDIVLQYLRLNPEQSLGPAVKEHASKIGITVSKFKDLLELTCLNLVYSDLRVIDELQIEYRYQEDMSLLGCDVVSFHKARVLEQLTFCVAFWKGLRETQGVDIEEAWKCRKCTFSNICEWKTRQSEVIQTKRLK